MMWQMCNALLHLQVLLLPKIPKIKTKEEKKNKTPVNCLKHSEKETFIVTFSI